MISIIVPVYNVEKYLPACLDSLINQTYRDIEIICVNDGSTDGSLAILEEYARKDNRIKIISQENKGLSEARNCGIEHINGEWTMFVDSDDFIDKECCGKLTKKCIERKYDLLFFSYTRVFEKEALEKYIFDKEDQTFEGERIEWLYKRLVAPSDKELAYPDKLDSLSTAWGKLYNSEIIKKHNIKFISTKEIGTEDLLFNVYYFAYIKSAEYIHEPLYFYRKNNITSLTKLYKPRLHEQWNRLFALIKEWIESNGFDYLTQSLQHRRALSIIGLGLNISFSEKSFASKCNEVENIISSAEYINAIKTLPLKYFPIHWKLFFFAVKQRYAWVATLMLVAIKKIITR
jgi:glycosyltransferase EpsH